MLLFKENSSYRDAKAGQKAAILFSVVFITSQPQTEQKVVFITSKPVNKPYIAFHWLYLVT